MNLQPVLPLNTQRKLVYSQMTGPEDELETLDSHLIKITIKWENITIKLKIIILVECELQSLIEFSLTRS